MPVAPTVKLPVWVLLRVRSAAEAVVVGSMSLLLPVFAASSPPPATEAVLLTVAWAAAPTFTFRVRVLLPPAAIATVLVQVTI